MDDIQHKLNQLSSNKETMDRMTTNNRDDLADMAVKVDNIGLELKDMQSAIRLQNKIFDSHAAKMVRKRNEGNTFYPLFHFIWL